MVTVEEVWKIILNQQLNLSEEVVDLENAVGHFLAEDLIADLDFPSYDNVRMDGIGIHFESFASGNRTFKIESTCGAGSPQAILNDSDACVEIMTGSILPKGTDTVIRYEDLEIKDGVAKVMIEDIRAHQNVHHKGKNRKAGDLIVAKGRRITPAEIGVAATIGKSKLVVKTPPKIAIISSGDELIPVDQKPLAHQIRRSNSYACSAQLQEIGISSDTFHFIDNEEVIEKNLAQLFESHQVLILSGGVSMGKFDLIPKVMEKLGVEKLFYKVKQRPGKPFWFGKHQEKGVVVFAFPGNPVSTFVGMQLYLLPWLRHQLGMGSEMPPEASSGQVIGKYPYVRLAEQVTFKPDLQLYMQVKIEYSPKGVIHAFPRKGKGSGDHANLADVDGFIILPRGREVFEVGELFEFIQFRKNIS